MSERYNIVQMNRFQFKMHDDEWHYGMVPDIIPTNRGKEMIVWDPLFGNDIV